MLTPFRQLLALMDASERRRFGWLMGLVALTGLVDTLGVASILPFLAVLTDPEILERNVRLAAVMARFGLEDRGQSLGVLGAVVAVLVQLPWTVTAFFALVIAGLLAAYRGSEPHCVDPFAQPSDDRDWPRLGSR
jgi:hypothetical protein